MPQFDATHVKVVGCTVVWDAITRPGQAPDGSPKYSLKVVVPPHSQDIPLFSALANKTLLESEFKGTLPAGGRMPIGTALQSEFNGLFTGWHVLNCNSRRVPDVYDENGQRLDPMQYGPLLYSGQKVDVLVHCYDYNNTGNRGIACGLDAFGIIASANAPRQEFGGPSVDTASAFGAGSAAPQPGVTPQQNHGMLPGATPPPPGAAAAPPPAEARYSYNGAIYTEAQLKAGGWTDAQIATLPAA